MVASSSRVTSGLEGWDGAITDDLNLIFTTPYPPASHAYVVSESKPYWSDGTNWMPMAIEGAHVDAAAGWADSTAQDKFNELLSALETSGALAP